MTSNSMAEKVHQGRNVKRFREMLGIKQEALAYELGDDWTQKRVSLLEQKEEIDEALLEQVSKVLKVPVEAIKSFDEQAAVNYFNTFNDSSTAGGFGLSNNNFYCTINPIEKWVEALEENKKLYERLLQSEREKVEMLQELLKNK